MIKMTFEKNGENSVCDITADYARVYKGDEYFGPDAVIFTAGPCDCAIPDEPIQVSANTLYKAIQCLFEITAE